MTQPENPGGAASKQAARLESPRSLECGYPYVLGVGTFGKVRNAKHKQAQTLHSIKFINQRLCLLKKALENILQKRKKFESLECPFLCNIQFAFHDKETMFLIQELKLGRDLKFLLNAVRYLTAEISLGVAYLHDNNIIHRVLKPANILVDTLGHACVTDLSVASFFKPSKPLRAAARTLVYMSPEMLEKQGYTDTTDWWSLGRPFRGKTDVNVTAAIISAKLKYPSSSKASSDSIDWVRLEKMEGKPVHVPDMKKFNFNQLMDGEDKIYDSNPFPEMRGDEDSEALGKISTTFHPFEHARISESERNLRKATWTTFTQKRLKDIQTQIELDETDSQEYDKEPDNILIDPDSFSICSRYSAVSEKQLPDVPSIPTSIRSSIKKDCSSASKTSMNTAEKSGTISKLD
ncbi:kinase-like domain-containing protein, partial [Chytriomyces cf. hyalinus JEL632]